MEIAGKKEEKCVMNIRLEDANGPAAFAKGLDATCLIAPEDVNGIEENFDMDAMNCEGPLYEAAKLAQ